MDEAGLQPGGSFLLGFLIFCTLFALQAAEKSSSWWDCWLTLESPTGEFGRAVKSPWIKKSPEALCACPGSCQADDLLLAPCASFGTPAITVLPQGPPLAPGSEN